jgi:ATP-dependent RNA helicase SUPV3L1/SUV3
MKKQDYIYKSTLKNRGWTDKLIEKFLPKPDKQVANPHYRSGPKANLYLKSKVQNLESSNEEVIKSLEDSSRKKAELEVKRAERKQKKQELQEEQRKKDEQKAQKEQSELKEIVNLSIISGMFSEDSKIIIHCGPTNSGKTYNALQDLKTSSNGCYLSPLRLLAWEVYNKLNQEGIYTSLITGEEKIIIPGSTIYSSTVEMFDSDQTYDCVVLDEAHMIDDENRGFAWLRVLLKFKANKLHIITSPEALDLISTILNKLNKQFEISYYNRLVPLKVSKTPYNLNNPIDRTIYVVFSRKEALQLKKNFENRGKKVSIVYGNLPPEVRRKQIEDFITQRTSICVATDAIGMGVNLPADRVCFVSVIKFDGFNERLLSSLELKQIAGRAGRFKLSEFGEVSAINNNDLEFIRKNINCPVSKKRFAKISPELNELMVFKEKRLYNKLSRWNLLNTIPPSLDGLVEKVSLETQMKLASYFSLDAQDKLGIDNLFKLIKAPIRKDESFWLECCNYLLASQSLPIPENINKIYNDMDLLTAEDCISQCEVYNWISNCTCFQPHCEDISLVKDMKNSLVDKVNNYLANSKPVRFDNPNRHRVGKRKKKKNKH